MRKKQSRDFLSKYGPLLPCIFVLAVIPLLVRMIAYDPGLSSYDWYPAGERISYDFFLCIKALAVIVSALFMLVLSIVFRDFKNLRKLPFLLIIYLFLVLLSGIFSPEASFAFRGVTEVFEPVPVLLSYGIIFWYAFCRIKGEDEIRIILAAGAIGAAFLCLICFLQFLNLDPFRTDFIKLLITPSSFHDKIDQLSFTFPDHIAYGSFYNTNNLIQYFGFVIPIALCIFFRKKSGPGLKLFCILLALFSFLALAGAYSKTGLAVLFITALTALSFFIRTRCELLRIGLPASGLLACLILFYALRFEGFDTLIRRFAGESSPSPRRITEFSTLEDHVLLTIDNTKLIISLEDNHDGTVMLSLTDEDGKELDAYPGLSCTPVLFDDRICLSLEADGIELIVTKDDDLGFLFYAPSEKWVRAAPVSKASLFPDSFLTDRGRLWNYIIPRLPSVLLLGKGANCFLFFYPQDDYLAKAYEKEETMLDVRAHSLYLQQFTENGGSALLVFLAFVLRYLFQSFFLYRKKAILNRDDFCSLAGFGIFLGVLSYLLSGLTVDSNVNTAPVFWLLFGVGSAINQRLQTENSLYRAKKQAGKTCLS